MVSNEEIGAASLVLAKAIGERMFYLRKEGCDPQTLVNELTAICLSLYYCIDPDELEALG